MKDTAANLRPTSALEPAPDTRSTFTHPSHTTKPTVEIDTDLHKQFKHAVIDQGTSMRGILEQLVTSWLRRQ